MTRLEQLWQFYMEDQQDPFNLYAYALELAKSDRQKALQHLNVLITNKPDYIASYYQAAVLCLEMNLDATGIFERGIAIAKAQNNRKALNELQALLDQAD